MKNILTFNNHKTIKGELFTSNEGLPYKTGIVYLSPYRHNSKNINLCSHASKGCAKSCLFGSGNGGMFPNIRKARINRTEYFLSDRLGFLNQLRNEIELAIAKYSKDYTLVIRLNGTSDLVYEKYRVFEGGKNIFEVFDNIQFYDYTKNPKRFDNELPKNYHLTFSRSETNFKECLELLSRGVNVSVVFKKVPTEYKGYKVVDGDNHDLTFLYGNEGVIIGLKYKIMTGKGATNTDGIASGFVVDVLNELKDDYNNIINEVKINLVNSNKELIFVS
jgi:hypothetical protein